MAVVVEATLVSAVSIIRDRTLGVIIIENDGTGDVEIGNYHVLLKEEGESICHTCDIDGFNRKESVFHLICRALNKMGYDKPKESQPLSHQQEGKNEPCNSRY